MAEDVLQFESGYLVETIIEGNKLGVTPHTVRVSPEGELIAVDSINSNIVRITPPLSACASETSPKSFQTWLIHCRSPLFSGMNPR